MIAQHNLVFSTCRGKVTFTEGTELKPATPEQIALCKKGDWGALDLYTYYTETYGMRLIDLGNGEAGWVFSSDWNPVRRVKRKLSREEIETEMARVADKIRDQYRKLRPLANGVTVTVTRVHGTNQRLEGGKGKYVVKVGVYGEVCYMATGTSELRALRNLDKQMAKESK